MRAFVACTLSLLCGQAALSQSHNFKMHSIDEGIPQSQVHTIVQDKKGFLWFGTDGGGLTRYDGKKFITYTTAEGLSNDLINHLREAPDGRIWASTSKGVSIFYNKAFEEVPKELAPLADLVVYYSYLTGDGSVIFTTFKGAFIYKDNKLEAVPELKDVSTICAYSDDAGNYLFGTGDKGLLIKGKEGAKWYTTEQGLPSNRVSAIAPLLPRKGPGGKMGLGGLYLATESGLCTLTGFYLDNKKVYADKAEPFLLPANNTRQVARSVYYDSKGNTWIGTWNVGIFRIEPSGVITAFGRNEGLGADGVYCTLEDHEGNIWIGTDGSGAMRLGKQIFTSYRKPNGMPQDMVLSLHKTRKGEWWFGHDNGASHYDGNQWHYYSAENGITNEKVWDIMEDTEGNIWLTTYGSGVFRFDGKKFTCYNEKSGLSSNNARSVFQDSKGRIWIGTANGLNLFKGNSFEVYKASVGDPRQLQSSRILVVMEDTKKRVWFCTSGGGLSMLEEGADGLSFKSYTEKEGLAGNVVLSVSEDQQGNMWAGSFGGISRVNPSTGEIKKITRKEGLPSVTVYAVTCTGDNHLLIATNKGLDKLDIGEFARSGKAKTRHFGKDEGFFGVECNTNSILRDNDNRCWIGTVNGAFIYDPEKDKPNEVLPPVHITNVRLFFENFDTKPYADSTATDDFLPKHMTFSYGQNHLTFDFAGLSYTVPRNVKYRYKLEGFDPDWTDPMSESFATYSNLPPGEFRFLVKSCNNDGVWNEQPASFSFTITPPFWKTWWFRLLSFGSLALSLYGIYRYRIRRLKKVQLMLEEQVTLKTKELRKEKEVVEEQSKLIEKKNHSITSSIRYAKRIQDSILPMQEKLNELIPGSFILFRPKDIVSGDFYWFTRQNGSTLVAAVDCTGHGVPGAFMSLIGNNLLNDIVNNQAICDPKVILEKLHAGVVQALKKDEQESGTVDGMDITLCSITLPNGTGEGKLEFASTGRPLLMVKDKQMKKYKIGLHPVGFITKKEPTFEKQSLPLSHGDTFYIYTDGYADQFGGPDDEKYLDSNFEKLLMDIQSKDIREQAEVLETEIEKWKAGRSQIDDILVIGIRA